MIRYNLVKNIFTFDIHFYLINLYPYFLWFNYCEIFMVVYSLNDGAVVKLSCSLDHVGLSYRFRSLIPSYIRIFSFSRISDPMTMFTAAQECNY